METEVAIWKERQVESLPNNLIEELEEAYSKKNNGKLIEICVREKLKDLPTIESIEPATPEEDSNDKVDFWVKIKDWPETIGVQFTVAEWDREYIEKKKAKFPFKIKKEDSQTTVVLCEPPDHDTAKKIKEGIEKLRVERDMAKSFKGIDIKSEEYLSKQLAFKLYGSIIKRYQEANPDKAIKFEKHLRSIVEQEEQKPPKYR